MQLATMCSLERMPELMVSFIMLYYTTLNTSITPSCTNTWDCPVRSYTNLKKLLEEIIKWHTPENYVIQKYGKQDMKRRFFRHSFTMSPDTKLKEPRALMRGETRDVTPPHHSEAISVLQLLQPHQTNHFQTWVLNRGLETQHHHDFLF